MSIRSRRLRADRDSQTPPLRAVALGASRLRVSGTGGCGLASASVVFAVIGGGVAQGAPAAVFGGVEDVVPVHPDVLAYEGGQVGDVGVIEGMPVGAQS